MCKNQNGVAIVEMVLLIVVVVGLILIFKEQITNLVDDLFQQILEEATRV